MAARGMTVHVVDAPSNLGLMPPAPGREPGVRHLPAALRSHGLVERLGAVDAGSVDPPPYVPDIEPMGVRNGQAIREYSLRLADRIERLARDGIFPLVLGGDCSILLGSVLGLGRIGRYGLAFIDGHTDFLTPEISTSKGVAGMDLAIATGRGPTPLARLAGDTLVQEIDVAIIGCRDTGANATGVEELVNTPILVLPYSRVEKLGMTATARMALDRIGGHGLDGFWIHLDVDVLDSDLMPAVDSPQPGGLRFEELKELLCALLGSPHAVGMQVTIFDPELDPGESLAGQLTDMLVESLAPT